MGKWIALFILLLHHCLPVQDVLATDKRDIFNNFLLEEPIDEAQCDQMQLEVAAVDSTMILDRYPRLNGKWVSPECEVRPGPEFLLRSYVFSKNNSFRLVQYFYEDESCILPLYSILASGELIVKESSWITPGGIECEYLLNRVTVIPHTTKAAENLLDKMKSNCPSRTNKVWKPHREYIVYSLKDFHRPENQKKRRKYGRYRRKKIHRDIDCLSGLGIEFNELMLMRTQTRSLEEGKKNRELFLGDIHSRYEARFTYKPTAFQVPLLKSDQAHDCDNCQIVSKSTERAPPHLQSKPQLPPLPHGQWVSQRCEVRSLGMFLTRKLSFDSRDRTWMGQYKFYADPFCMESAFAISASGKYFLGPIQRKKEMIRKRKTGTNFDFHIEHASLTLYDYTLKEAFNTETNCGIGPWYVGVSKELSSTSGCSILGIILPTVEYELIKLEIDSKGTPLLFIGQPDTENKRRNLQERPTSYQAPLAQCSMFPQQTVNNHLEPVYYARTASHSAASGRLFCFFRTLSLFTFLSILKDTLILIFYHNFFIIL